MGFFATYAYLFVGSYFFVPTLIASDVLYFSQLILAASHLRVIIQLLDQVDDSLIGRDNDKVNGDKVARIWNKVVYEHQEHLL